MGMLSMMTQRPHAARAEYSFAVAAWWAAALPAEAEDEAKVPRALFSYRPIRAAAMPTRRTGAARVSVTKPVRELALAPRTVATFVAKVFLAAVACPAGEAEAAQRLPEVWDLVTGQLAGLALAVAVPVER